MHGHRGDVAFDRWDTAAAGIHDHGDALAILAGNLQCCVREGLPSAGDREMCEAVHAANRLGIHELLGIEVGDFGGDLDGQILGVKMLDATDAGAPGHQSFPQRGDTDAKRRYRSQTGHHDPFHDLSLSPECPWTYRLGARDHLSRTSAGRPRSVRLSVVTSRLMRRMSPEST